MKLFAACLILVYSAAAETLPITLYNNTGLKPEVTDSAMPLLSRIFRLSGIDLEVRVGDPSASEAHLVLYPLREDACRARRDIALRIRPSAAPGVRSTILGEAMPFATGGVNVTVYLDRAEAAASRENRPLAELLAHVIAHEIGHVLLRSREHAKGGLMSSHWGETEFRRMPAGSLLFAREEGREMVRNLAGLGCPQTSADRRGGGE